jgi:hypothetical protein
MLDDGQRISPAANTDWLSRRILDRRQSASLTNLASDKCLHGDVCRLLQKLRCRPRPLNSRVSIAVRHSKEPQCPTQHSQTTHLAHEHPYARSQSSDGGRVAYANPKSHQISYSSHSSASVLLKKDIVQLTFFIMSASFAAHTPGNALSMDVGNLSLSKSARPTVHMCELSSFWSSIVSIYDNIRCSIQHPGLEPTKK